MPLKCICVFWPGLTPFAFCPWLPLGSFFILGFIIFDDCAMKALCCKPHGFYE